MFGWCCIAYTTKCMQAIDVNASQVSYNFSFYMLFRHKNQVLKIIFELRVYSGL